MGKHTKLLAIGLLSFLILLIGSQFFVISGGIRKMNANANHNQKRVASRVPQSLADFK